VLNIVKKCEAEIKRELISDDMNFTVECSECEYSGNAVSVNDSVKLIDFISLMRSGPVKMSPLVEGMVETSYNLAVIRADINSFKLTVSSRSSVESSLDDMERLMASFGRLAGFNEDTRGRYPGWQYAEVSPLRDTYLSVYKELFDKDGIAIGIHAGLECGLLVKKVPDMDIISIGPDIKDLHSPSESMSIASLDRLYDIVLAILKRK
jgi:dipeptidase D